MKRVLGLFVILGLLGCGERDTQVGVERPPAPDGGCAVPCGDACCDVGQVCATGSCCAPQCAGRECGPDGCGGECGACPEGSRCDLDDFACVECPAEEDVPTFCARLEKECGPVEALDDCGRLRAVHCGTCEPPKNCNPTTNRCECAAESDDAFCLAQGVQCGPASGVDNCGTPRTVESCGECFSLAYCDESGRCQLCADEPDVALCARVDAECGDIEAVDRCGDPRSIASCGSCEAPLVCEPDHRCALPVAPPNDTCSAALPLSFDDAGVVTVEIDTTRALDDYANQCTNTPGADVVFQLPLPSARDVRIEASPSPEGSYRPSLSLRAACDEPGSELGCAVGSAPGAATVLEVRQLAAGTYYLLVDSVASQGGPASLTVTLSAPEPGPENDFCAGAQVLSFDSATGMTGLSATTAGAFNDATGSCAQMVGGDLFYKVVLDEPAALRALVLQAAPGAQGYEPSLYLRRECTDEATEVACGVPERWSMGGTAARIAAPLLEAGVYTLVVDGALVAVGDGTSTASGAFTLEVARAAPMGHDVCAGALPVAIDPESGVGTAAGDTAFAADDAVHSCLASAGADLVYSFEVPAGQVKNAIVEVVATLGSTLRPVVAVRRICADLSSELACARAPGNSPSASLLLTQLSAGTYYLWVDGTGAVRSGQFDLTVSLTEPMPPPPHDDCSGAQPLTLDAATGLVARASGSTLAAADDLLGSCGEEGTPHSGGDVVYALTSYDAGEVAVNVYRDPRFQSFRPAVTVLAACDGEATELACANENGGVASLRFTAAPRTTYFVVVDGISGSRGEFLLEAMLVTAAPNSTCAGAAPLAFDASGRAEAAGDTCAAANSTVSPACLGSGKDVVYFFETTATKDLTFLLRPGHGSTSVLALRTVCSSSSDELGCNSDPAGLNALHLRAVPPGTYYLWVDSTAPACGAFTLTATATDPQPAPAHDDCQAPLPLVFDAHGVAQASGDLGAALDSGHGSCKPSVDGSTGPDLVYSFTLEAAKTLTASLVPAPGSPLKPALYLRASCDEPITEKGCVQSTTAGRDVSITIPRMAAGTYYVWVDAAEAGSSGAFLLSLTATPPVAGAANDRCSAAMPLSFDAAGKASINGDTTTGSDDSGATARCATAAAPLGGPDLVYSFELTSPATVVARVIAQPGTPALRPAVYVRSSCAPDAAEAGCASASGLEAQFANTYPPGTWYVFVDGVRGSAGGFTLELTSSPAVDAESCLVAEPLVFDESGVARVTRDTGLAADNAAASCQGSSGGGDYVFRFTLESEEQVTVSAAPALASPYRPLLHVRRECDAPESELVCRKTSDEVVFTRLRAGTYSVWLDSQTPGDQGTAVLTVTRSTPLPAPVNDICRSAQELAVDEASGRAWVTGSTAGALDDSAGSCGSAPEKRHSGPDVFYRVEVSRPSALIAVLHASAASPDYAPALYLVRGCPSEGGVEVDCANALDGGAAVVSASNLPPGDYHLVVDGLDLSFGEFTLEVAVGAEQLNDTCEQAQPLALDANGFAEVLASLREANADTAGSCSSSGRDLVYSFSIPSMKNVVVDMIPHGELRPAVHLRSTCDDAKTEKGCTYKSSSEPIQLVAARLPAGTYYLVADAYRPESSGGAFTLKLRATDAGAPPPNDTCAGAVPLELDPVRHAANVLVDTTDATHNYTGSCYYAPDAPDVVFKLTLDQPSTVTASLAPDESSPTLKPAIYVRRTCTGAEEVLPCKYSTSSTIVSTGPITLPPGEYFVVVDALSKSVGISMLTVTAAPNPTPGELCYNALPLSFEDDGTAVTLGDSTAFSDETRGLCASSSGEVVYTFTTTAAKDLEVVAERDPAQPSNYRPLIYLRSECDVEASELACAYNSVTTNPRAEFLVRSLPPGTYYLFADAYSGTGGGPFRVTATLRPPSTPVPGDTCSDALPLTLDASGAAVVVGNTEPAANDYVGSCGAGTTAPLYGADLVYRLELGADALLTAILNRDSGNTYRPGVHIRSACEDAASELACALNATGSSTSMKVPLGSGTYYVIVDGGGSGLGGFTLNLQTSAVQPGDGCFNAIPLVFDPSTGIATETGDNSLATGWDNGSCYQPSQGDLVYRFTTTAVKDVEIEAGPAEGSTFKPEIYVRRTCEDPSTQLACKYNSASAPTKITLKALPAGTYFVFVDSPGQTASFMGRFVLTVKLVD